MSFTSDTRKCHSRKWFGKTLLGKKCPGYKCTGHKWAAKQKPATVGGMALD